MLKIPFSSLILLALFMLLGVLLLSGKSEYRRSGRFIAAWIILLIAGTLRWEWHNEAVRQLQPLLAACLPHCTWRCFTGLTTDKKTRRSYSLLLTLTGVMAILGWPQFTDIALFILYVGYGFALIKVAAKGENAFVLARLDKAPLAARLTLFAGSFLCFSALVDLTVSLNFVFNQGLQVPLVITLAQACVLPFICLAILLAGRTLPAEEKNLPQSEPEPVTRNEEQEKICAQLEEILINKEYYLDANLTLNLLARKSGVPARQISNAVNTARGCNVSQWINGFRIKRAQNLLLTTNKPITEIMLEAGFLTKSNFNREFLRLSGMAPGAFRQAAADNVKPHSETH
ncbi:helix-turn-helix domain-containing protein [Kalamiella sp. sgz302252]|uniref:helix-turn-helix domain-containing protein n=1 Tax=Pantoea sp. sgz302252 TaxID=3341827 RepID=UPI0036D33A35